MDFQNDNAAAAANAARAGSDFWSNLMNFRQQQAQLPGQRAQSGLQQNQLDLSNQLLPLQVQTAKNQATQSDLTTGAAKRANNLDVKNYYLNTVTKPDVGDSFQKVTVPYEQAEAEGQVAAGAENHPPTWDVPYNPALPFVRQPKEVQQEMVNRVIASAPEGSAPITPDEATATLAHRDYSEAAAKLPPITPYTLPGGMAPTKLSGGPQGVSWEAANPGVTPIPGQNGARSGFVMAGGEVKPDPMALAPKEITASQNNLTDLEQSQNEVQKIRDMIGKNPELVGRGVVSGGSAIPRFGREALSYLGASPNYAKQNQIQQFLGKQLLNTLGQVHIGRVTEMEWNQLQKNMPTQDSPKEVWDDYLDRLSGALQKTYQDQAESLRQNGTPVTGLPPISRATKVAPPNTARVGDSNIPGSSDSGSGNSAQTVSSRAEYEALPKGASFVWGPTGQRGTK